MIHSTLPAERPRERCLHRGANALSLRECLALLLGSGPRGVGCLGLADALVQLPGAGLDALEEERAFFTAMEVSAPAHLAGVPGLGPAARARLLAAMELARRYSALRSTLTRADAGLEQPRVSTLSLARLALREISPELRQEPQEWLGFVPLHRSGLMGRFCLVERGVRTHVNVDPAELFARVLALRPRGFFLFHNHPSGICTPSEPDRVLTERAANLAADLGLRLYGHWIVGPEREHWLNWPVDSAASSM
jgi:DNA repair protein RadC